MKSFRASAARAPVARALAPGQSNTEAHPGSTRTLVNTSRRTVMRPAPRRWFPRNVSSAPRVVKDCCIAILWRLQRYEPMPCFGTEHLTGVLSGEPGASLGAPRRNWPRMPSGLPGGYESTARNPGGAELPTETSGVAPARPVPHATAALPAQRQPRGRQWRGSRHARKAADLNAPCS
jgi:hypothetical protein